MDSIFLVVYDQILTILAGNKNIHLGLDGFEFQPDPITDY